MGHSEGCPEKEVHSNTGLPKNDRIFSHKQTGPTSTKTGEKKTIKVQN